MPTDEALQREIVYWRELLTRVAEDLESTSGKETDPKRAAWFSGRAMRIRQRLHEGMPEGYDPRPNRPAATFRN